MSISHGPNNFPGDEESPLYTGRAGGAAGASSMLLLLRKLEVVDDDPDAEQRWAGQRACARWLVLHRLRLNLTVEELAARAGLDADVVSYLELGLLSEVTAPSASALLRMAEVLVLPPYDLAWTAAVVAIAAGQVSAADGDVVRQVIADVEELRPLDDADADVDDWRAPDAGPASYGVMDASPAPLGWPAGEPGDKRLPPTIPLVGAGVLRIPALPGRSSRGHTSVVALPASSSCERPTTPRRTRPTHTPFATKRERALLQAVFLVLSLLTLLVQPLASHAAPATPEVDRVGVYLPTSVDQGVLEPSAAMSGQARSNTGLHAGAIGSGTPTASQPLSTGNAAGGRYTYDSAGGLQSPNSLTEQSGHNAPPHPLTKVSSEQPFPEQPHYPSFPLSGNPVNTSIGNFTYTYVDLTVPAWPELELSRTYNSQSNEQGVFGQGWSTLLDARLTPRSVSTFHARFYDYNTGIWLQLTRARDGSYRGMTPRGSLRLSDINGQWVLERATEPSLVFSSAGQLVSIRDRNGNSLTFSYRGGRVTTISDGSRTLSFEYNAQGHVVRIMTPGGQRISYSYTTAGSLAAVMQADGGQHIYRYDSSGRLTQIVGPTRAETRVSYDGAGRVQSTTDANGQTTSFAYDLPRRTTTVIDPNGNRTIISYDLVGGRLLPVTMRDTLGGVQRWEWDGQQRLVGYHNSHGAQWQYRYDADGNLVSVTDPEGGTTTWTYDSSSGRVIRREEANGAGSTYAYDTQGNLLSITDALGFTTHHSYDENNNLVATADRNGNTTRFAYDHRDDLVQVIDALGNSTSYAYDDSGNVVRITDARGYEQTFTYDALNRLTSATDATGATTRYQYDLAGNLTATTDALGNITRYSYDSVGRLLTSQDPLGFITAHSYDANGNLVSVRSAGGGSTRHSYDGLGRRIAKTDALGGLSITTYDKVGNISSIRDANGGVSRYEYDALNRLTKLTDPLSQSVQYTYDAVGNRVQITDPNGNITRFAYDLLGRLVLEQNGLGDRWTYTYDANGNQVAQVDPLGRQTRYTYDALNRLTEVYYADGSRTAFTYDPLGRRTSIQDETGAITFQYDPVGQVVMESDIYGRQLYYAYDPLGRIIQQTYPNGLTVGYTYDASGRLTAVSESGSQEISVTYDPDGNTTSTRDRRGTQVVYEHDVMGRVTLVTRRDITGAVERSRSFVYDRVGNLVALRDGQLLTSYAYDPLYRLTSIRQTDGTDLVLEQDRTYGDSSALEGLAIRQRGEGGWESTSYHFRYDRFGRLLSDGYYRYAYNVRDQLVSVWDMLREVASYSYDAVGQRTDKRTARLSPAIDLLVDTALTGHDPAALSPRIVPLANLAQAGDAPSDRRGHRPIATETPVWASVPATPYTAAQLGGPVALPAGAAVGAAPVHPVLGLALELAAPQGTAWGALLGLWTLQLRIALLITLAVAIAAMFFATSRAASSAEDRALPQASS